MTNLKLHPTSVTAVQDKAHDRENLARQIRTGQMMREQAREQINATQVLTEIMEIDLKLQGEKDVAGNMVPLEREIISALKARADIKFKLLGKVLPDLKATESISISHATHEHTHEHTSVTNMELAQRLQLWRRNHQGDLDDVEAKIINPPGTDDLISPEPLRSAREQQADHAAEIAPRNDIHAEYSWL
jgi:hypothetical protein